MTKLFTTAADSIPVCRVQDAFARGVQKNILICAGGGIGDQICAEPTVRYALETFEDCKISVLTRNPDFFAHLPVHKLFTFGKDTVNFGKYLVYQTYLLGDHFSSQFVSSIVMNAVDFGAITLTRGQLPIEYRQPILRPPVPRPEILSLVHETNFPVYVHAGRTWTTRTFPKEWWGAVVENLRALGCTPILIGADTEFGGTVDLEDQKALDLRGKTTVMETVYLLQNARVLLTNDSSPLHMASSRSPTEPTAGRAWVGFIATARRGDFLYHFRSSAQGRDALPGDFGWRMKDFSRGGVWDLYDFAPNRKETFDVREVASDVLLRWLPKPAEFAAWARGRWDCCEEKHDRPLET